VVALLPVLLVAALLTGCGAEREISSIEPVPSSREVNNPELGPPAVDPLSFGPGEKDSPSWSPSGDRVAFIVDGYVSDKALSSENSTRRTTRDLGAKRVTWPASGKELAILGEGVPSGASDEDHDTHPFYVTRSDEGQLKIERLTETALAMSDPSGDEPLVAALEHDSYESRISTVDPGRRELEIYPKPVEGRIEEISVSPDGGQALAAVVVPDNGSESYEIHTFDLESGESQRVTRLGPGMEMFGSPQQTSGGIYYVAGEREGGRDLTQDSDIRYSLYQIPAGSASPKPASGVGQDFIASSIKVSPDGTRLALLGRRDSGSATNLYVLDLSDGILDSTTANENMEIRTGVDSLDWRPDGESVAIVARSDITGPRVYDGSASTLLATFYNLYEIPVGDLREKG
jgi:Tol biopolymer transport system component